VGGAPRGQRRAVEAYSEVLPSDPPTLQAFEGARSGVRETGRHVGLPGRIEHQLEVTGSARRGQPENSA